jgi:AAA15 family ATPase/GTPase
MIRRFRATRLNGKISCDFELFPDINIITGRNGSGKTTVLKALWYLISANIERITREMTFDLLEVETDKFTISIRRLPDLPDSSYKREKYLFRVHTDKADYVDEVDNSDISREEPPIRRANETLGPLLGSIFFPTFRRIEGGFSMVEPGEVRRSRVAPARDAAVTLARNLQLHRAEPDTIQSGFASLSARLSLFDHLFVSSISTDDIVRLLTDRYAAISEATNRQHRELSDAIILLTTKYSKTQETSEENKLHLAQEILKDINKRVLEFNGMTDAAFRPFTILSELVSKIFKDQGIKITENIVLGDIQNSIDSGMLSSGEKQMLSFLCYNALSAKKTIFIDEPEISLHVDWQRILFPTLVEQNTGNQFVIATHSPFIYTKYADKELILNIDRGEADAPEAV